MERGDRHDLDEVHQFLPLDIMVPPGQPWLEKDLDQLPPWASLRAHWFFVLHLEHRAEYPLRGQQRRHNMLQWCLHLPPAEGLQRQLDLRQPRLRLLEAIVELPDGVRVRGHEEPELALNAGGSGRRTRGLGAGTAVP